MRDLLKYTIWLILFVVIQGMIVGQLNFGYGIHPMIYPLFILLLPFDVRPIPLIVFGFITGIGVDFFMNTFGLNASACVLIAFLRPFIYNRFAPRDGYDSTKTPIAREMGYRWFLKVAGITVLIHHFWFFVLEYFKWSSIGEILTNTILSSVVTLLIFMLIQVIFFNKHKQKA